MHSIPETPPKSRKCARRSFDKEWQPQKERIRQLYIVEDRPLFSKEQPEETVARLMEDRYGFKATERQYKRRIERWQFKKYTRAHEIEAMIASSSEGNTTSCNLKSELPPSIETRKIKRYQRRQVLRALRDTSTALHCPDPPRLKSNRAMVCDGSDWMRSYLTIYKLEKFYQSGVPLIQIGLPVERLARKEIPLEKDWLALFVAQYIITVWPGSIDSSPVIDMVRGFFTVMPLPDNTVFFAIHCIQRLRMFAFDALDLPWYPNRLLVVGLMLANQFLDDTPYSKFDWADVSGIPLKTLRYLELRYLLLTDFRLLQPPQGGWDLFLEGTKGWLATLRWEFGGLWPEETALPPLPLMLEMGFAILSY